jgi:hypothetical protein
MPAPPASSAQGVRPKSSGSNLTRVTVTMIVIILAAILAFVALFSAPASAQVSSSISTTLSCSPYCSRLWVDFPITDNVTENCYAYGGCNGTSSVVFYVYPDAQCSTTPTKVSSVSITADGTYKSARWTPTHLGTYCWKVDVNSGGQTVQTSGAEVMTVSLFLAVPQFPLGFALLFAVMIPALLVLRSVYSKGARGRSH